MNPWRWRKAIRKRPRKCNGKSISEGAEQQSWWNELQSADYLFRWGETRTSPSWALFVLCKLLTCSFRAPWVSKSIFIELEWFIFRWTVSFIVLCVFHDSLFVLSVIHSPIFPDLPTDDGVARRNVLMSLPTIPPDLFYRSNRIYCVVSIVCCVYHVCRK